MLTPTRTMAGNLRWTRSGLVWADFLLYGLPYGLRPTKDKYAVRALHQALFRALPGESLLLGICSGLDPAAIVERMLDGVDLGDCPAWAAECEATLDSLDRIGPGQRIFWLSVPLGTKATDQALASARAALDGFKDLLSLPRDHADPAELGRRADQAARVWEAIPSPFRPEPVTAAQMVWLHEHTANRGLYLDLDLPTSETDVSAELLTPKTGAALGELLLDEGGQTDRQPGRGGRRPPASWNPLTQRYLKVQDAAATEASYQAMLVISDVPDGGMLFPGSEIVGRIDECGLDVDWAMRLNVRSSRAVAAENQRALRNLNEQYAQRDGELSHGLSMLDRVASDLAEYVAVLESDKLEVEVQATTIFSVAATTANHATTQARALADYLGQIGYKLVQPLGFQEELWWAMQPGTPTCRVVREFSQITTSKNLAATVPLASNRLGDDRGSLLALNIGHGPLLAVDTPCGPTSVILHDAAGSTDKDVSGSLAIAGELGAGKSFALMRLGGDVVDRGGRIIAADRTAMGEYALWAESIGDAVVADVTDPKYSMDPLKLFAATPPVASRITQSFLTPLLDVTPTSERGVLLSDVLDPAYLDEHRITSAGALLAHLLDGCQLAGATELGRLINVFARRDLGRVIFDSTLPPLPLSSPAIVIRTHTLELPSREELQISHLFEQLKLEKVFGRALYAFIAALARHVCFSDLHTFGAFINDECHATTISPEGERELVDFVRDGRKHRAAVFLGSHDPETDFGSPTLRGLIPTRILMRHRDKTLAQRGLKWLDLDPGDDELVTLIRTDTSPVLADGVPEHRRGECLIRDSSGNVGRGKILQPAQPARAAAVRSGGARARQKDAGG